MSTESLVASEPSSEQETATLEADRQRKRDYLLVQVQNLLINATTNTVAKLDVVSNAVKGEYSRQSMVAARSNDIRTTTDKNAAGILQNGQEQTFSQNESLLRAIERFRNETVICPECYGDLFVV